MYFYYVWVRSSRYHGQEALTYASAERLPTGSIVQVPLQKELVNGLIVGPASEPRFKTKPISRVYDLPPIPAIQIKLGRWLQAYYPAPLGAICQQFLPANFSEKQLLSAPLAHLPEPNSRDLPRLSTDQLSALETIQEHDTYLIHGETGSGKTRLYIELALRAVTSGKSAIILTPEISLTSQLAANFRAVFGERVVVLHSQQTPAERQKAWLTCLRATEPLIVIGPRSALFTPLSDIGLIILDEAHETAYKQEQAPQYHASRVAAYLAQLARATLILGSATPSVSDFYMAEEKHKPIINLGRITANSVAADTDAVFVDMKDRSQFARSPYLSSSLITAVGEALKRGEQSLLYLNRRGTARLVLCEKCGWQASCPHCDIPLTYHGDSHQLRCHSCDYHTAAPSNCPACGHPSILFKTAGTKAIADDISRLFPEARIGRYDTDNNKAERFEQHYERIKRGEIDILIGTQLLAKGLDLPKLSTLGVLLADTSMYVPDYTAQERTFQLLCQVLGRVGRGHVSGTAVIQTYRPDHPLLQQAVKQDYISFYNTEIEERKTYLFPPFCHLLKLSCRRATNKTGEQAAEKLKETLLSAGHKVRIEGPAPSFHERFQGKYQWQLVVKATSRSELLSVIGELPANWSYDIDPIDLL